MDDEQLVAKVAPGSGGKVSAAASNGQAGPMAGMLAATSSPTPAMRVAADAGQLSLNQMCICTVAPETAFILVVSLYNQPKIDALHV